MHMVMGILALLALAYFVYGLFVFLDDGPRPGEKQTYLFEDEEGERTNPFAGDPDEDSEVEARCRRCGRGVESETFQYCDACTEEL